MKKNLITVIILALVLANLILTAILTISVVPQTKKANDLITQVCSAINLELKSGSVTSDTNVVPVDQLVTYAIPDQLTINLKDTPHVAVLNVSISMDEKNEGYKKYGEEITAGEQDSIIKDVINSTIREYTYEQMTNETQAVQTQIVKRLQQLFDSDFIVSVGFPVITCQ